MDPRTAFILATAFALLNGGILGLMHRGLSNDIRPAAIDWRIGTLLAAGGTILLAAQSPDSAWLVLPVGNACLLLGFALYWRAVRRFDHLPDNPWLFAPALIATLALSIFTLVYPILWVRVVIAAIGWAVAMVGSAHSLLQHRKSHLEIGRITLAGILLLLTAFMIFRAIYFALMMRDVSTILVSDSIINVLTPLSASILPVIGTTAFLMMCSERLRRELASRAIELDEKNTALIQAIRAREDAERIARHDLKTPLASIAATPALIRANQPQEAEQEALLRMIENAARRALSMVNLSLDLYRMENGRYEFTPEAVDLKAITCHAIEDLGAHASSKQVRIEFHCLQNHVYAAANAALSYSCIANILKNAIEAASDGSVVSLNLAATDRVELSIHNDTAVPPNLRERFFEKYATQGKAEGSGLGTYSSHLIAAVQNGTLSMQTSDSSGTTLTLVLDRYTDALDFSADDSTILPKSVGESHQKFSNTSLTNSVQVLVVDDDVYNCKVISRQLLQYGVQIKTALNGRLALESCLTYHPNLIFMDIEMPIMGGIQAMQAIRALQQARRQIPSIIVAFSSDDGIDSQARFLTLGFDLCLSKPASSANLNKVLEALSTISTSESENIKPVYIHPNLITEMTGFIASRFQLIDELQLAITQENLTAIASIAHKLNGSLGMYGFCHAALLCQQIERKPDTKEANLTLLEELTRYLRSAPIISSSEPIVAEHI